MRRRVGIIAQVVLLAVLCIAVALLLRIGRDGGLSQPRLFAELRLLGMTAIFWIKGPGLPVSAGALGFVAGWISGGWRTRSQIRRRSLLLVDSSGPDMPFMEGVRHVTRHAGPWQNGTQDAAAAQLLLGAAREGRLSLWRSTPTDVAHRISPRQLRRMVPAQRSTPPVAMEMIALAPLSLIRREVEVLWPPSPTLEGKLRLRPTESHNDAGARSMVVFAVGMCRRMIGLRG